MEKTEQRCASALWFRPEESDSIIYLDNGATTFQKPSQVYEAVDTANRYLAVNAGRGSYTLAKIASEGIGLLRQELIRMIQAPAQVEVVFAPSATCALNQIIGGMTLKEKDVVYVSPFEHNAVMRTLYHKQETCGFSIQQLPLTMEKMEIDLQKCEYLFQQKPPTCVFVTHVSNVTGYILPVERILTLAKECTEQKAKVVVDGSQALGLIPVDYRKLPFDAYVFAGHKTLYAPFGIAGFYKARGFCLEPFLCGGTGSDSLNLHMPQGNLEPGSYNIPAIAGLYAAVEFIKKTGVDALYQHEKHMTERMIQGLQGILGVRLYLPKDLSSHVGIVSFSVEGYLAQQVGMLLDEDYHIAVRTGYHCAPLIHEYLEDMHRGGTVRASVSYFTTEQEIQRFIEAVREIAEG